MIFRTVKHFPFKPVLLFINSCETFLHLHPRYARLLHNQQSRVKGWLKIYRPSSYRWLLQNKNESILDDSCQRFSSCGNKNKYKQENEIEEDGRNKDEDEDVQGQQSVGPQSILHSIVLADFKAKLISGQITSMLSDDWSKLEKDLLTENPKLKLSWEAICMSFIKMVKSIELSFSLANYVEKQGRTLNIATMTSQIHLIGKCGGPERHQQVLDLYKKLMGQTNGILDVYSLKNVLRGLCGTSHWKESFKLLEVLQPLDPSLTKYYTPMLLAALREGDEISAIFLLNKLGQAGAKPEEAVYTTFLKSCINGNHLNVNLLLNLMGKYRWFPLRETLFEIIQHLKRDGNPDQWKEAWVMIKNGFCPSCKQILLKSELTSREFKKLQSAFLEKTLIGDDIYQRSHPVELENFKKFIEQQAPFDVVVDSLNVACKMTKHNRSFQLRKVIEYLSIEKCQKVLVIGRKHMKQWNKADIDFIIKNSRCFFLENISKDDPYLLYATIYGGPKTMFVSSDEMRDHKFLLGEKMGEIFTKWQQSRQIQFLGINRYGKVILEWPRKEIVKAQFNSVWHIPYDDGKVRPSWQDPFTWLCLKQ